MMEKKGFTLVELAIVLVIIGLLIGGVLVAKSMIVTTKINKLVMDIRRYDIAVSNFYLNYKYAPGDVPYFAPPGNGDDILSFGANGGASCAAAPNAALSNIESWQFWAHLSQAKMLDVTYIPWSPTGTCAGGTHSASANAESLAGIVWPYTELGTPGQANKRFIGVNKSTAELNLYLQMYVKPDWAAALETKMSAQNPNGTMNQIGLVNNYSLGDCRDEDTNHIACDAAGALFAVELYFIAPPQ